MISFTYTNHRGEIATRRVSPESIEYIFRPGYDYEPGWFLSGYDHDKKARRSFAFANIVPDPSVNLFTLIRLPKETSA